MTHHCKIFGIASIVLLIGGSAASAACMPSELKALLNRIEGRFGSVQVVSTDRPGARIAGSGRMSYHASCRAVDFNPPAGKYDAVVAWLHDNHGGGVGTYGCGMHHIHIDTGPKVHWHTCAR